MREANYAVLLQELKTLDVLVIRDPAGTRTILAAARPLSRSAYSQQHSAHWYTYSAIATCNHTERLAVRAGYALFMCEAAMRHRIIV